jgi:hypothetical protein
MLSETDRVSLRMAYALGAWDTLKQRTASDDDTMPKPLADLVEGSSRNFIDRNESILSLGIVQGDELAHRMAYDVGVEDSEELRERLLEAGYTLP